MRLICFVLVFSCLTLSSAFAQTKVALVIGNSAYEKTSALENPKNDAKLISKVLRNLKFDVIEKLDLSQKEMKRAVSQFAQKLEAGGRGSIGLFYYAGHGVQVNGVNYLIPVNAEISSVVDVEIESVDLNTVTTAMDRAGNGFNIVVLDACRDNPFKSTTRSLSRGLARVDAPKGSLLAYATSPGDVAADGEGVNSPYSAALAKVMQLPGLTIERVFKKVRLLVHEKTNETQTPWESSSLTGDFYFLPQNEDIAKPVEVEIPDKAKAPVDPDEVAPEDRAPDAQIAYLRAVETNTLEGYEDFLRQHPTHENAARVRQIIQSTADDKMWGRVRKKNNIASYRRYLAAFPDGAYKAEAGARIQSLQDAFDSARRPPPKIVRNCGHPHGPWRAYNIASNDVLNIRQGPSTKYPIIGSIPYNGVGVSRGECTSRLWCFVKYKCVSGWASGKFLTRNNRPPVGTDPNLAAFYKVIDHVPPDKLNVRRGPGVKYGIVGRIPHNGTKVRIFGCKVINRRGSKWYQVQWGRVKGWASGRYLANMATGARP